jgi:hypothetical protein
MGEVGREICEGAGVAWLDLSGNARIISPGLRIVVDGRPNRFKRRGRPSTAFAPKASRIARWLLMNPKRFGSQRQLARIVGLDEGYVSRVVARLEEDRFIIRDSEGGVRARDPELLLDAWREVYDFSKHEILRGHVAARSSEALVHRLAEALRAEGAEYAATGLSAAWLIARFAGFRLASFYLSRPPSPALLEAVSFREEASGANVWLIAPMDAGVFHGAEERGGVRCVHPVQAHLDLSAHPERAREAANELRSRELNWKAVDG